jgi:hypothetical protein
VTACGPETSVVPHQSLRLVAPCMAYPVVPTLFAHRWAHHVPQILVSLNAAVLAFILIWNGLFLLINAAPHGSMNKPGALTLAPLLFAFFIGWGTKRSVKLQKIILKDTRSVNEIKSFLSLIQTVSALLLVVFAVLLFTGALS